MTKHTPSRSHKAAHHSLFIWTILFLLLVFTQQTLATDRVIVSDVDDTLKISHVSSKVDSVLRIKDTHSRFLGMSELLQDLAEQNPNIAVYYLTKAPAFLMQESHLDFLENGNFPEGTYIPYRLESLMENHKIQKLRQIIRDESPREVVVIGDNAEQDSEIYAQLKKENPQIRFYTFIHQLYKKPIVAQQTTFVTPVEIALALNNAQFLSTSQTEEFIFWIAPLIEDEAPFQDQGIITFPSFINCSDFQWSVTYPVQLSEEAISAIQRVRAKTNSVCSKTP